MENALTIRRVPLDALHLDPSNAREHPPENLEAIAASLKHFGQAEPLVVQKKTGRVIGGNGRLVAMRKLGWRECDVVEVEVDDLTATALGIALNRTSDLAAWNDETLAKLLQELRAEDALEGVGYSEEDIDALLRELERDLPVTELDDPGPGAPPAEPVTRPGDLWVLGDHRLLCGDSTKPEDVERVMGKDRAKLVATDPPYLVDYTGERPNDSGNDWTATYREIDIEDAAGFFRAVFENVLRVLARKAAIYCWHAHKRTGVIQRVWESLGIIDHQQIIWVKPTAVFGRVYWHFRHEPCMMGWARGSQPEHDGKHEHNSVWEVDWDGKARVVGNEHPCEKPVELFARPMRKHTRSGEVCFEPFSGSGSQLIACEQLSRRCRAIEISPAYVDVALRRWKKATGKSAVLEGDGRRFAEIAAERSAQTTEVTS
jgi:DNA modification methylase